jgi:HSP90 family molecular chaperone
VPSRELALSSPYYEAFKRHDKEVLFVYNTIDDFVMANLQQYHGKYVYTEQSQ